MELQVQVRVVALCIYSIHSKNGDKFLSTVVQLTDRHFLHLFDGMASALEQSYVLAH